MTRRTMDGKTNLQRVNRKNTLESTWHKPVQTRPGVLNACLYTCEDDSRPLFLDYLSSAVSFPAFNRLLVFVQTPSLADLIKKYIWSVVSSNVSLMV